MENNWHAMIVLRPDMMANAVYITRSYGDQREYLRKNGKITVHTRGAATKEDPYMALLDDEQLRALGIAINKSGYKAPDEHLLEGKLVATERHLEDMRKLVFEEPRTVTREVVSHE